MIMETTVNTDLVIFDLDGTLLDTIGDLAVACNAVLALRGLPQHSYEEYCHFVGKLIMRAEGWEERIPGENIVFDPRTMATAYRSDDYYIPKPDNFDIRVTPTAPGRYELHTRFVRALPPVGTILTFKGVFTQNRHSPAIHATASSGVLVEDVTIHHCGGMGLIAEKADNVTVRRR